MRVESSIVRGILAGALWLLADVSPVWPQNSAALIGPLIGAGTGAVSSLSSMAAQQRAAELQREQAQQLQQTRQLQQDQAAIRRHPCLPGSTSTMMIHADGTKSLIYEQR
jgi:type VI protein secretion system component VasK